MLGFVVVALDAREGSIGPVDAIIVCHSHSVVPQERSRCDDRCVGDISVGVSMIDFFLPSWPAPVRADRSKRGSHER